MPDNPVGLIATYSPVKILPRLPFILIPNLVAFWLSPITNRHLDLIFLP